LVDDLTRSVKIEIGASGLS